MDRGSLIEKEGTNGEVGMEDEKESNSAAAAEAPKKDNDNRGKVE